MGYEKVPCPSHLRTQAGRGTLSHQATTATNQAPRRPAEDGAAVAPGVTASWLLLSVATGEAGAPWTTVAPPSPGLELHSSVPEPSLVGRYFEYHLSLGSPWIQSLRYLPGSLSQLPLRC